MSAGGGAKSLPEVAPLTPEQRSSVARSVLTLRLAGSMKKRGNALGFDELQSVGNLELVRTASRYDPAPNVSLDAYAYVAVRFAMRKAAAAQFRHQNRKPLEAALLAGDEYICAPSDGPERSDESEEDPAKRLEEMSDGLVGSMVTRYLAHRARETGEDATVAGLDQRRALAILREELEALPRHRELIQLRDFEGREWADVAAHLGVAQATACRQHAAAMQLLGARLRARGVAELMAG
jgi:RNA polymerase sigma factor (sigma-70 family)